MADRPYHDDELLPDLASLVALLTEPAVAQMAQDDGLRVERLSIDLPFEMQVLSDGAGGVSVQASAPTQRTETTVLPVWHRLALSVEVDHA